MASPSDQCWSVDSSTWEQGRFAYFQLFGQGKLKNILFPDGEGAYKWLNVSALIPMLEAEPLDPCGRRGCSGGGGALALVWDFDIVLYGHERRASPAITPCEGAQIPGQKYKKVLFWASAREKRASLHAFHRLEKKVFTMLSEGLSPQERLLFEPNGQRSSLGQLY